MTAIQSLRNKFSEVASGLSFGFRMGWVTDLASGVESYPILLLRPPDAYVDKVRGWSSRDFSIKFYLINLDRGVSGDFLTEEERSAAWGGMDTAVREIVQQIGENPSEFQIMSGVTIKYDSGGADGLLPDKVIWVEVEFKLKAVDCG